MSPISLGLIAGGAGTAALSLSEVVERNLSASRPLVYAPVRMVARLMGRAGFTRVPWPSAQGIGALLRWIYGPAIGAIYGSLRARECAVCIADWRALGGGIYLFELVALPAIGAAPPVREWPGKQVATLALHTFVFALVTEFVLRIAARISADFD